MPKKIAPHYEKEKKKNKGSRNKNEKNEAVERETQSIDEYVSQTIVELQNRHRERKGKCCIVALPTDSRENDATKDDSYEVTNTLISRLAAKNWLANPWLAEENHPRPIYFDELMSLAKEMENQGIQFSKSDVLYLSGHGTAFSLSGVNPNDLAEKLAEFINSTGITQVKLAACNSGARFSETEIKRARAAKENLPNLPEAELSQSYVQRVSAALAAEGIMDIDVYGYRGSMIEGKEGKEAHTYTRLSSVDMKGKVQHDSIKHRASDMRVHFRNGEMEAAPKIQDDDIFVSTKGKQYKLGF